MAAARAISASARPRCVIFFSMLQEPTYFFITAYDCDEGCEAEVDPNLSSTFHCQGPLDLRYKLEMTNGRNSWKRKHFSADEARCALPRSWTRISGSTLTRFPARPQIGILQLYISTTCIMVAFAFQTFRIMAGLAKKKKCVEVARDAACATLKI